MCINWSWLHGCRLLSWVTRDLKILRQPTFIAFWLIPSQFMSLWLKERPSLWRDSKRRLGRYIDRTLYHKQHDSTCCRDDHSLWTWGDKNVLKVQGRLYKMLVLLSVGHITIIVNVDFHESSALLKTIPVHKDTFSWSRKIHKSIKGWWSYGTNCAPWSLTRMWPKIPEMGWRFHISVIANTVLSWSCNTSLILPTHSNSVHSN